MEVIGICSVPFL
jgi:hypothetical protein